MYNEGKDNFAFPTYIGPVPVFVACHQRLPESFYHFGNAVFESVEL